MTADGGVTPVRHTADPLGHLRWRHDAARRTARASSGKRVLLAQPRGYCAGVERAIDSVEKALAVHGAPVYVRKQIVHNKHVVADLEAKGAIFVEETAEVPEGSIVVLSAHGVAPSVYAEATQRKLRTIDATCPLVTKVHHEARRFSDEGLEILLIGHAGHEEVVGTAGQAPDQVKLVDGPVDAARVEVRDPSRVAWLSQTTLSVDETLETVHALRARFPQLMDPPSDDICYATQNRQAAVKQIAPASDLVIVVGSRNSSNSVRLVEVALESRRAGLVPGRRCERDRRGVARRRDDGRGHERCVGSRLACARRARRGSPTAASTRSRRSRRCAKH